MGPQSTDHAVKIAIRCGRRLCRDALASCIGGEPGMAVAGQVADDADLLNLCRLNTPDVVLFDACTSGMVSALDTLSELRRRFARTKVVVIYEHLTPAEAAAGWPRGIDTLIPCSHGLEAVLVVLRRYAKERADSASSPSPIGDLTEQERQILSLVAAGHPVSSVAAILGVSTRTVDNCKRRAYNRLDVANQGQAIARAAALGLLYSAQPALVPASKPGTMLVVLRGPSGPTREAAIMALLAGGVAFVVEESTQDGTVDARDHWDRGPVLLVVVEPEPNGRNQVPGDDGIPTLLIPPASMRHGEAMGLLRRGVVGIITPGRIAQALVPALTLAATGHLTVDPAAAAALVTAIRRAPADDNQLPQITSREEDILRSIAEGDTVRQTARALGIAPKTVENIQARLFRKLGVRNRASAVAVTHALGLLGPVHSGANGRDVR